MQARNPSSPMDGGYKIILAGDSSVGKTCIANRIQFDTFDETISPTISPGLVKTTVKLPSKDIEVNIWDTAGQERFNCMVPIYARNSYGVVLVFDLTNRTTLDNAENWYNQLKPIVSDHCQFILCGNKEDILQETSDVIEPAQEWADKQKIPFIKVSAKNGNHVNEMIQTLVQNIYDTVYKVAPFSPYVKAILDGQSESSLNRTKTTKSHSCC